MSSTSKLASFVSRHQLVRLLDRAAGYRRRGRPVPYRLQILIAVIQTRVPDAPVDKRRQVDSRMIKLNRGKHVRLARSPAGRPSTSDPAFVSRVSKLSHLAGWNSPGKRPIEGPKPLSARELARRAKMAWNDREWPVSVSAEDRALLYLVEVEGMDAPAIAARQTKPSKVVTAAAIRKRFERARAKLQKAQEAN